MTVAQTSVCDCLSRITHRLKSVPLFRPKEKVGENPPDNDDADPIRKRDYTERREGRQTAGDAGAGVDPRRWFGALARPLGRAHQLAFGALPNGRANACIETRAFSDDPASPLPSH